MFGKKIVMRGAITNLASTPRRNTEKQSARRTNTTENMAIELTDSNFEELALKSDKPVMVDFWAEWCGPCRMVGPVVEEIAKDYEGKAVVGKVNVDNNPQVAMKYGIRSIPTILFLKNGEVVDRSVGAVPKSTLSGKLDGQLN